MVYSSSLNDGKVIRLEQVIAFGIIYFTASLILKWFTIQSPELSIIIWIIGGLFGLLNCTIFYNNLNDVVKPKGLYTRKSIKYHKQ